MVKVDDHWIETALISIAKSTALGGSDVEFAAESDEMTFSGGERDIDVKTLLNGGNMRKFVPMTPKEVTFKIYPDEVSDALQLFYGTANAKASGVITTTNTLTRFNVRVVILWTDKAAAAAAAEAIDGSNAGIRLVAQNGNVTKCEEFWDDGEMGFEVTLKIPAFTRAAVGNHTWTSTDGAGTMSAVGNYP